MQKSYFMRALLLGILVLSCACAKSPSLTTVDTNNSWQSYIKSADKKEQAFRTQMSLRYGVEGDTRRVTALLWGNNTNALRLDVNAGIGVNVAKIYEDDKTFLVFITRENVAYYHDGEQKPLFNAGVPIPFNLQQLTQIIEGKFSTVFGTNRLEEVKPATKNAHAGASIFTLSDGTFSGELTINAQGLPLFWQAEQTNGWSLSLGYKELDLLPYKLTMEHAETGKRAILLIKERESPPTPFTPEQMRLILPDNTAALPLEEAKNLQ